MATTTLRPLRVFRNQRVFRNFYQCTACVNEWDDFLLTRGTSFCPACDAECEPYCSEEFEEEWVDEAEELD